MGLESVTFISDLVSTNPVSTDLKSDGDDHIRRIKSALLNTFPLVTGAVSVTHMELNALVGVTTNIQSTFDSIVFNGKVLAWGKFAGGTGAIFNDYNIDSITHNSTGNYTVNFTNSLSTTNYSVFVSIQPTDPFNWVVGNVYGTSTVDACNLVTRSYPNSYYDPEIVHVVVVG